MRLLFSNRTMDMVGGVQRSISTVVNEMAARGHEVDLLTWDQGRAEPFFPISPEVRWHRLDLGDIAAKAGARLRMRRAAKVRELIRARRPQVLIVFRNPQFLVMRSYSIGLGIPAIAAERGAPSRFDHVPSGPRRRFIEFNALRLARRIVIQRESYRSHYPGFLRERLVAIPNPVYPASCHAVPHRPNDEGRFRVLSVGRLHREKNHASLIRAFQRVSERFPEWDLVILGDGDLRPELERMVGESGLAGRVRLLSPAPNVSEWYAEAHLFCLPSRHEGFPNALAEAQAHGLPAVGFAGCAGVNELIEDGATGRLAPGNGDVPALAEALASLMSSHEEREMMGPAARKAMKALCPDAVMNAWERLFEDAINR